MPHISKIFKQGESLAVSLPKALLDELGLSHGDQVSIELIGRHIEITPFDVDYNQATDLGRRRASKYRDVLAGLADD